VSVSFGAFSLGGRHQGVLQSNQITKTTVYEIYTLKEEKRQLDTIHERQDDAMHEARRIYGQSKHIAGVKVLEEKFDSDENRSATHNL
jgi:hypothetical protein